MKYTREMLAEAVKESFSIASVLRKLKIKQAGGSHSHIKRMIDKYKIDCSHFTGQSHGKGTNFVKKSAQEILVFDLEKEYRESTHRLKRALIEMGIQYRCSVCEIEEYNGKPITFHVDHIDGNNKNNLITNLRFICPNCHSQTETYCGKNNKKTSKSKPKDYETDSCPVCGEQKPTIYKTCSRNCSHKQDYKADWWSFDLLKELETKSKSEISKKLNVSDVAVSKWVKKFKEFQLNMDKNYFDTEIQNLYTLHRDKIIQVGVTCFVNPSTWTNLFCSSKEYLIKEDNNLYYSSSMGRVKITSYYMNGYTDDRGVHQSMIPLWKLND